MPYPLLIPGIAQKIEKVIKKLELKPKITPRQFIKKTKGRKHRYSSVCLDKKGKKLIFYASLHKKPYEKQRMATEVRLARILIKEKGLKDRYFFHSPRYFEAEREKDFGWLTREYFPDLPVEKLDEIERLKKRLPPEKIREIRKTILEMQALPVSKVPFLKKFDIKRYSGCAELARLLKEESVLSAKEAQAWGKFLKKNKELLKKENKYFCHGDFQIGNIIIFDSQMKIIDFESAHINNFAFDIAFLTTRLWKHPHVRRKLIQQYFKILPQEKKGVFPSLFRIDAFFVGYYTFRSKPKEYSAKEIARRRCFFKKLLKAGIKSFDALMKVRN